MLDERDGGGSSDLEAVLKASKGDPEIEALLRLERIGPYRIVDFVGEGGMGTVYLAEQEEPVHRRVALKVVRSSMVR